MSWDRSGASPSVMVVRNAMPVCPAVSGVLLIPRYPRLLILTLILLLVMMLVMLDPWSYSWKVEGPVDSASRICMGKLVWYLYWRLWGMLLYWRCLLGPLLLLLVVIVAVASTSTIASSAAVASSAVSIIVLIHCIQRCCYQRLDLILDSHAHSLDLHLHVVDDGLTVSQC
jgi:hypothetical protein